jgi:hypothetical protein
MERGGLEAKLANVKLIVSKMPRKRVDMCCLLIPLNLSIVVAIFQSCASR